MVPVAPYRTSLARKVTEIGLAVALVASILLLLKEAVPPERRTALVPYGGWLLVSPVLAALLSLPVAVGWHLRERRGGPTEAGARWHARLRSAIRYGLALQLTSFGLAKLVDMQFHTPNYVLDRPLRAVTGYALTWYYFGASRPFDVILGLIQVTGAALLLGRRTTLLGVLVLLPVLVNIFLINIFYDIAPSTTRDSLIFTLGLTFLLALEWPRLRPVLFALTDAGPAALSGRRWAKWGLRGGVLLGAAAVVFALKSQPANDTILRGVWRVDALTRAGRWVPLDSLGSDPQGWTRLYFAGGAGSCVFRFHPDRYEPQRELRGRYTYDAARYLLRADLQSGGVDLRDGWRPLGDSLTATVTIADARHARLHGMFGPDSVDVTLTRLRD